MREFEIKKKLEKILIKLYKKDRKLYGQIMNKIQEVVSSYEIEHYKNLRYDMRDSKRVHIGHFVLVFSYDKKLDFLSFEYFDHHDRIYGKK
jgi:mRNA-degrading endonuclease RelE of RelBE toxin-antitoxin system